MKNVGKKVIMVVKDHSLVAGIVAATTIAITAITAIVVTTNRKNKAACEALERAEIELN